MSLILALALWLSPQPCISYATICVPGYVVKWLPAEPVETDLASLVAKYWPSELQAWAMRIIECETGGTFDPYSYNPSSGAAGLFQFLRSTWDNGPAPALGLPSYWTGAPYNAEWNIQAAAWLYANWGGTSQWSCKR